MSDTVAPPSPAHSTKSAMSAVDSKLGPLPVWAWGAIATAGFFVYEWWHNRTTSTTPPPTQPTTPANPGGTTIIKKGGGGGRGKQTIPQQPPAQGQLQQFQSTQENLPAIPVGSGDHSTIAEYVVPPASQRTFDPVTSKDSDYMSPHESGKLALTPHSFLFPENFNSSVGGSDTFLSGARYEY